jgi:hypothetical protein
MPRTVSAVARMKLPSRVGMTANPCGKMAGLTEMEQNAAPQAGVRAFDASLSLPAQPGQSSIPPIEAVMLGLSSCAIAIGAKAIACPASPMPKATSRISARRRASVPSLIEPEVTPAVTGFKPGLDDGRSGSRSRVPEWMPVRSVVTLMERFR